MKRKKTFFIVSIVAIAGGCIAGGCKGCNNQDDVALYDSDTIIDDSEQILNLDNFIEEGGDEDFEYNNPWSVKYFKNEWDEDTDDAYLTTTLQGTGWNLRIDYIPNSGYDEVFRFSITEDGYIKEMHGPATILIRQSDGETYQLTVEGVKGSMAFVENKADVQGFKMMLDEGKVDILMEFEKYNERHKCMATYYASKGFFSRAISNILN